MIERRFKLLNHYLKKSKKIILFEFKLNQNSEFKFKIGLNNQGVGYIDGGYNINLCNINYNDYGGRKFLKYLKNPNFKHDFLKSIQNEPKENLEVIKNILHYVELKYNQNDFKIDSLNLKIKDGNLKINSGNYMYGGFNLLGIDIEKEKNQEFTKEILKNTFSLRFSDLLNFSYIVKRKKKFIKIFEEQYLKYFKENIRILKRLEYVDLHLKPYEAVENI
ncbi:unnamed protein product [marine sediment metagenome]|uniref:Uncharacterized protein n=1 Tax=marine sediment metagenome TaxID=412755 RepID=X0WLI9_9ZZZZ